MKTSRALLPHQVKALDYFKGKSALAIFMEMRLGKSKVAIEFFKKLKGQILVIAPLTTLRASWKRELRLEGEHSISLLTGHRSLREERFYQHRRWNLVNYEGLRTVPMILSHGWSGVIVDESARLRNPRSLSSQLICSKFKAIPYKAILSGQPAPESPLDYVQQFIFLKGDFMGFKNWWQARNVMCFPVDKFGYHWLPKPSFIPKIKTYLQKESYILSRKQAGLQNKRVHEIRNIPLEKEQKNILKKAEQDFVLVTEKGEVTTLWKPVVWNWMCQVAGGFVEGQHKFKGKMNELVELIRGELKNEQVVVWFRFNIELITAYNWLPEINCGILHGGISTEDRTSACEAFREGKIRVMLCQEKVGLYGLDFSVSSTNIYYSNGYSSEVREQTKQRIENPNKKDTLLDIDLVTEGTLDETIIRVLNRKKNKSLFYLQQEIMDDMKRRLQHGK